MSFFSDAPADVRRWRAGRDDALLHRMECRACPLAAVVGNLHPNMAPTGAAHPLVYMLGEAPGGDEDEQGRQFVGDSGKLLRPLIPGEYRTRLRWNNCVRTRPPKNRTPTPVELECCRPSIVRDIEVTKPRAIFGFGNVPLEWATGMSGITLWRGRRIPVRIGRHSCWFYPMLHPSFLLRNRGKNGRPSDDEMLLELDLERAFGEAEDLPTAVVHTPADVMAGTEIISEGGEAGLARVRDVLAWAVEQPFNGVDYETNGLRPYATGSRILTIAVGARERAVAFPFDHPEAPWTKSERQQLVELWCAYLRAPKVRRIAHNLAFELEWTGVQFGAEYVRAGRWEDTAVQASILDERHKKMKQGPFSLDWLVLQYFGFHLKSLFSLNMEDLENVPLETLLHYNAPDAKYCAALFEEQDARIRSDGLEEPYRLALRRVPTVVLSQMRGAPVDQTEVRRLKAKYDARVDETESKIALLPIVHKFRKEKGEIFNPQSTQHVHHVFVNMLRRPECEVYDKWKKDTKYSTDESVLSKIEHPLARLILDLRRDRKRRSTYVDVMLEGSPLLYPDGCIHYQLNTIFAETGRLTSDSPNIQNYPKRDDEAVEVRRPIVAPPGHLILAVDYGQIEARVIAMFTRDVKFCRALWDRYDIHLDWAERIARRYPKRIGGKSMLRGFEFVKNKQNKDSPEFKAAKDFRTDIKNQWTFPLVFGATANSASGYLGIPLDVIEVLWEEFWEEFSGIRSWQKEQLALYRERGYVSCLTGRRRRVGKKRGDSSVYAALSTNQILNSPIQGTAAEIVMDGMCRLSESGDPLLQPEINIHDDLTFLRVPEDRVDEIAEKVVTYMLDAPWAWAREVPLTVEMSCGRNWQPYDKKSNPDGLQEIDTFSSDEWFGFRRPARYA